MKNDTRTPAYRLPTSYFAVVVPLLLVASILVAIATGYSWVQSPFTVEVVQCLIFAGLLEFAFVRGSAQSCVSIRDERKHLLALFGIVWLCAFAAFVTLAFFAHSYGAIHTIFPILFPALTVLVGNTLVTARGMKVVRIEMSPATRVLVVSVVGILSFAVSFGLSLLFWRAGVFASDSHLLILSALSFEVFLQLFPFALYALTLREALHLEGDPDAVSKNA